MKRDIYIVKSYNGGINKIYHNYKCAYNYCKRLITNNIDCGIWRWSDIDGKFVMFIGC